MPKVKLTKEETFFYAFGASSHRIDESAKSGAVRSGILLANAERIAEGNGWYAAWTIDRDAGYSGRIMWEVTLRRDDGKIIGALGGIGFATDYSELDTPEDDDYARVVFAELASEAIRNGESR